MAAALPRDAIVAVIGSGAMGSGIAQVAAAAGYSVRLFDARAGAAGSAIAAIGVQFGRLVEKGRMSGAEEDAARSRLRAMAAIEEAAGAALVIEAVVEDLSVKRRLFAQLEQVVDAGAILATNTSSLSVTAIAAQLQHPQRLVGMHFFNPPPLMALVEIVSGLATDPEVAASAFATAAAWGKEPVHARSTPGFIVNRVARPYYAEGLRLLLEQAADPATIDALLVEAGGFRMGPFALMDLIGHDVNLAVTRSVFEAHYGDPRFTPSILQQELVDAGYLGRKSGRGFYRYGDDAAAPQPRTEPAQPRLDHIGILAGALGPALERRFAAAGIELEAYNGMPVFLTDGRSATERAVAERHPNTVLVDWCHESASRVALARADQCSETSWNAAVGLFQAAGFAVTRIEDVPGMVVMRTVAMLANEAFDTVYQGICSMEAVDLAMRRGVNYPRGPLAWAEQIGLERIATVLANLAAAYGDGRYRVSPLLRRKVAAGGHFHGPHE
jgi:3-hydroxybutyryl-CoA dehydrogenase